MVDLVGASGWSLVAARLTGDVARTVLGGLRAEPTGPGRARGSDLLLWPGGSSRWPGAAAVKVLAQHPDRFDHATAPQIRFDGATTSHHVAYQARAGDYLVTPHAYALRATEADWG